VTFACGPGGPAYPWADPDVEDGIGGSEECLILLARELAKLGHQVVVYNNCADRAGVYHEVEYRTYDSYDEFRETDVLVAWRNWYLLMGKQARYKWLWCHDVPVGCHCPCKEEIEREDSAFNHIDKLVLLNDYHKRIYMQAGIPEERCFVAPIGVDPETFDIEVERDWFRVLYFSHPNRGLDRLREIWPRVKAAVPQATLASFWWEPEHWRPANEALGILPMRKLGYREIAVECKRAGVFGYPSIFAPEISPATTIKAQFGGATPVCIIQGGMVDTVKNGFFLGVTQENYADVLIHVLSNPAANVNTRELMMKWARETYSWASVAKLWSSQWV
jgi:glycosyltransferase involved in cell wall biosynthesis